MYVILGDIKKCKYFKVSVKRNISAEMNKNTTQLSKYFKSNLPR